MALAVKLSLPHSSISVYLASLYMGHMNLDSTTHPSLARSLKPTIISKLQADIIMRSLISRGLPLWAPPPPQGALSPTHLDDGILCPGHRRRFAGLCPVTVEAAEAAPDRGQRRTELGERDCWR